MRADGIISAGAGLLCHAVPALSSNRKSSVFQMIFAFPLGRLGAVAAEKVKNAENEQICRYSSFVLKVLFLTLATL